MWNIKRLPPNVFLKVNSLLKVNVRMTSKKVIIQEKSKVIKSVKENNSSESSNLDVKLNESDSRKVIRRSSMICSEGFDKYTYDCQRRVVPSRPVGLEVETTATPHGNVQSSNNPSVERDSFVNVYPSAPNSVEQSAVKKISSSIKALSSLPTAVKNAPRTSKSTSEESASNNTPLSYKRVPEETIPIAKVIPLNSPSNKSSVTTIPLSFNSFTEATNWKTDKSLINNPAKSAPIKNSAFSFKNVPQNSVPVGNAPSTKFIPEKSHSVNKALSFREVSDEFAPVRNKPLSMRQVSAEFSPKNAPKNSVPVGNSPVSTKFIPEKSHSVNKALSFREVSDEFAPVRNKPLSMRQVSAEFTPKRGVALSFKNVSEKSVSDEPIPVRNSPLCLKRSSVDCVSLKDIPLSLLQNFNRPASPIQNIPISLQSVPEESLSVNTAQSSNKTAPTESVSFWNAHLSLKPKITKHISLLKKKSPSLSNPIIKRDSVVHPGRTDMQKSLFIDGRFQNPWPTWRPPTFTNVLKFGISRNKSKVPSKQELDLILPIVKQNFSKLSIPDDGIRVTWIGHSTVLIQMHGLNILTDPIFSDRASPSQVVGPKRYRDPPCTIHDLPHINAVVISHSHYDHLDHTTVTLLNARFGSDIRWFVPLGLQVWLEQIGCENVVELDWWEENCVPEHSDTFFVFTPAQHWSKRALNDDNKVLWGSWCVLGPKYKFFFAGDTGYCEVFKQIGRVHGPFDLSAIPIGAYEPRWFMKHQHVNPEEAVQIHLDVKSKKSLAVHWGTFSLANEYYLDPPVKLRESLDKHEIPPEMFFTMKHGESRLIAQNKLVRMPPVKSVRSS